jgi:nitrogen fixation/metabolism regulation signal transduction histidine kinase
METMVLTNLEILSVFKLILIIFSSFLFSQEIYEFTEEEVKNIFNSIQELEFKDSINTELIEKLENQIYMYIDLSKNDSLLILKQDEKILLLEEQVELHKQLQPKWWEKPLWFGSGLIITWIFK